MIKLWNYTKTPMRGVSAFEIAIDDLIVYRGELGKEACGQTVLFTDDVKLIRHAKPSVQYCGRQEQSVLLINERQVMEGTGVHLRAPMRRGVGAYQGNDDTDVSNRPQTAVASRSR